MKRTAIVSSDPSSWEMGHRVSALEIWYEELNMAMHDKDVPEETLDLHTKMHLLNYYIFKEANLKIGD